jgi:predicted Fe-Mo cluster-binding NifX family protein
LKAANIKVYNCPKMSMKDALEQLKENKLEEAKDADVEGHWI